MEIMLTTKRYICKIKSARVHSNGDIVINLKEVEGNNVTTWYKAPNKDMLSVALAGIISGLDVIADLETPRITGSKINFLAIKTQD